MTIASQAPTSYAPVDYIERHFKAYNFRVHEPRRTVMISRAGAKAQQRVLEAVRKRARQCCAVDKSTGVICEILLMTRHAQTSWPADLIIQDMPRLGPKVASFTGYIIWHDVPHLTDRAPFLTFRLTLYLLTGQGIMHIAQPMIA